MMYYIELESGQQGPLDLLGIIRKIRNGQLSRTHMVSSEHDIRPKPAYQHSELYDIFVEQERYEEEQAQADVRYDASFIDLIRRGTSILKDDMTASVFTAMLMLCIVGIVYGAIKTLPTIAAAIIAPYICYVLFEMCLVILLRLSRVQLLSWRFFAQIFQKYMPGLLVAAIAPSLVAFTLPWLLSDIIGIGAWGIAFFAGLPVIAYFLYVPLIIVDRAVGVREAFGLNHRVMKVLGVELLTIIIGLITLNLIAAVTIALPLIVLPVTLLALMELYNDQYSDY